MANDLTARPLKIDTVMGASAALGRPLRVTKVYWENPTTAGHTFVIADGQGTEILLEGRASTADVGALVSIDFPVPVRWKDFRVITLGSGTLWIYTV